MKDLSQQTSMLDTLCPMHTRLSETGHIRHVGPTLRKLFDGEDLVGKRFLELFALKRPHRVQTMADLRASAGVKLHLKMRSGPETELKGVVVQDPEQGHLIVNLSFGISVVDGVRDFKLSSADFAPTDLTIEMLYLIEAKSAAMDALNKLNDRLQSSKVAAEEQAFTDTLTGLKNRRAMEHIMARLLEWKRPFAVMQVDLDFFKAVNDTMGHAAGDHVLQAVARIMVDVTRGDDTVSRVGGDEFVILLPGLRIRDVVAQIGERLIEKLEQPIPFAGQECCISASIGSAFYDPSVEANMETLMSDVDVALYASKRAGRRQQTFYSPELRTKSP